MLDQCMRSRYPPGKERRRSCSSYVMSGGFRLINALPRIFGRISWPRINALFGKLRFGSLPFLFDLAIGRKECIRSATSAVQPQHRDLMVRAPKLFKKLRSSRRVAERVTHRRNVLPDLVDPWRSHFANLAARLAGAATLWSKKRALPAVARSSSRSALYPYANQRPRASRLNRLIRIAPTKSMSIGNRYWQGE